MVQSHTTRVALPYLHAWRLHRLMSISELSQATGVSRTSIIELEHGRRAANLVTVGKLSAALGVSRRELVDNAPPSSDSGRGRLRTAEDDATGD